MNKTVLATLVDKGYSTTKISNKLGVTRYQVRKYLKIHRLETVFAREQSKYRDEDCPVCGNPSGTRKFCSKECKGKQHTTHSAAYRARRAKLNEQRRQKRKHFILLHGGECVTCGYNKNYAALEFHHKEPGTKRFSLNNKSITSKSMVDLAKEAEKCLLLCRVCHAELHNPDALLRD